MKTDVGAASGKPLNEANPVFVPARNTRAKFRIIYGGSGGGKSVFVAQDEMDRAWNDPRQRILVLRKVGRTIRHSCFQLLLDVLRDTNRLRLTKVNRGEMTLTFPGGGQIITAGLDDVAKLKSITGVTRIWIEEAAELKFPSGYAQEPDLAQIDLRLRGVDPVLIPQITLTFNPTIECVKLFEYVGYPTAGLPDRSYVENEDVFVQHTTYLDNPDVGRDYVKVFRRLGGVMQEVYEHGRLAAIDAPDQLIRNDWVRTAFAIDPLECAHDGLARLSCDPARYGDDETVIGRFYGWALTHTEAYSGQDTTTTGMRVATLQHEYGVPADRIAIDSVGVGSGTHDTVVSQGINAVEIIGGASPIVVSALEDMPAFNNLRSQMWYFLRSQLENGRVAIAVKDETARKRLQEDLLVHRYRIVGKKLEVEPKQKSEKWGIKNRLGRSPDYGDMLAMGVFVEHVAAARHTGVEILGAV